MEYYLESIARIPYIEYVILLLGLTLGISLFIYIIHSIFFKRRIKEYHSHWNGLIENLSYSTNDIYNEINNKLKNNGVDGVSSRIVKLKEGGIFSSRRTYLRVTWKEYQYDFCAAPFGDGFFFSWWLLYRHSIMQIILTRIPFFGGWFSRVFFPITYYKVDTASMFMTFAQSQVMEVIDGITKEKSLRTFSEKERTPEVRNIFSR